MKKRNRILSLLLAGVMALGLTACGASNAGAAADETGSAAVSTESASSDTAASGEKIINVGVTNTIGSLNPLLLNGGEINKYATGLMFLPCIGHPESRSYIHSSSPKGWLHPPSWQAKELRFPAYPCM